MSRPKVIDQFSNLPVSRQRKWQLRQAAENNCIICAAPKVNAAFCLNRDRQTQGSRRSNAATWRLENGIVPAGKVFRDARKVRGWTMSEVSSLSGLSLATICDAELRDQASAKTRALLNELYELKETAQ